MRPLVDTCTLIWLTTSPNNLSPGAASGIDSAEVLYLSEASLWEICLKWQSGKLSLPQPPRNWCEEQIRTWRLETLAIAREDLYRVSELPMHHRDPFDRLLVAQALRNGLTIVTPDKHIAQYPVSTLW